MYGSPTPKRSWAYSNASAIMKLDVGWKRLKAKITTVEKYKDSRGKMRYKGTSKLRQTEHPGAWLKWWLACLSAAVPRFYPEPFALSVQRLRGQLMDTRCNSWTASVRATPIRLPSGPDIIRAVDDRLDDLFGFADLASAYAYVRGYRGLKLPEHWNHDFIIPRFLPERQPVVMQD